MNTIYVVGIGPGQYGKMTLEAVNALRESDVIVGYTVYVDLVREHFPGKEFLTTPMRKEAERCRMAFEEAMKGRTVAMICSGDAGVYGMSGLMYEIGTAYPQVETRLIVNRIRRRIFRRTRVTVDDIMDTVGLPLLGIVPEDEAVPLAAAAGAPLALYAGKGASLACLHMARRLLGIRQPFVRL